MVSKENYLKKVPILFLGLSNKIGKEPFDSTTLSGKVVDQIISLFDSSYFVFYKRNLVLTAPLDDFQKLRYPTKEECERGLESFEKEMELLQPAVVICFGTLVCQALKKLSDPPFIILEAKHPAYVAVYQRSFLLDYCEEIKDRVVKVTLHSLKEGNML